MCLRNRRTARRRPTFPFPEDSEALAMPADDGVRCDDPAGVPPGVEKTSEQAQEEPVGGFELWLW